MVVKINRVPIQVMKMAASPPRGEFIYVADCPVLRIASHGLTEAEASKSIHDMIQVYFEELLDMGTLDHVMVEYGWKKNVVEERAEEDEAIWVTPQISYGYAMTGA